MVDQSPFIMIADDEDESTFTLYDMATKEPIIFAGRELAELELDDANRMAAVLDSVDPALWRNPKPGDAEMLAHALALYDEMTKRAEGTWPNDPEADV